MKKLAVWLSAIVVAAVAMTGCNKENDGNKDGDTKSATVSYSFSVCEDLYNLTDITISYIDETCTEKTMKLDKTEWKMEFSTEKTGDYGFTVSAAAKSNIDELGTKDEYTFTYSYSFEILGGSSPVILENSDKDVVLNANLEDYIGALGTMYSPKGSFSL